MTKTSYDILRIIACLFIFLFHSSLSFGIYFDFLTPFLEKSPIFMTDFFILSGFLLYLNYNSKFHEFNHATIKNFIHKRFFNIMPLYWFTAFLFYLYSGIENLKLFLFLLPIEILGLQSVFSTIFCYSHFGYTWFISCILICYYLFPYLCYFTNKIDKKKRIILAFCLYIFLSQQSFIVHLLNCETTYSNPLIRMLEFLLGIIVSSIVNELPTNNNIKRILGNWFSLLLEYISLIAIVSLLSTYTLFDGLYPYGKYNFITIPVFILTIVSSTYINIKSKLISYIVKAVAKLTFPIYLFQFPAIFVVNNYIQITNNAYRLLLTFGITLACGIIWNKCSKSLLKMYTQNK